MLAEINKDFELGSAPVRHLRVYVGRGKAENREGEIQLFQALAVSDLHDRWLALNSIHLRSMWLPAISSQFGTELDSKRVTIGVQTKRKKRTGAPRRVDPFSVGTSFTRLSKVGSKEGLLWGGLL